jgi:hypothetical protein
LHISNIYVLHSPVLTLLRSNFVTVHIGRLMLPIFLLLKNQRTEMAKLQYHRFYQCSGIKHCQYAHPDILRVRDAYGRVKLENINDLRRNSSQPSYVKSVETRIKRHTEGYSGWRRECAIIPRDESAIHPLYLSVCLLIHHPRFN